MTAPFPLTPAMRSRKLQLLGWVKGYIAENGQSPTMSEISAGVGISEARVKELVRTLVGEGRLHRGPGKQRRLRLPDERDDVLRKCRELGMLVDEDALTVSVPRRYSDLPILPPLRHLPPGGTGDDGHGHQSSG